MIVYWKPEKLEVMVQSDCLRLGGNLGRHETFATKDRAPLPELLHHAAPLVSIAINCQALPARTNVFGRTWRDHKQHPTAAWQSTNSKLLQMMQEQAK